MKIGIITMHKVLNYGSALQAYALQKKIKDLGHEAEIIDYQYPNKFQYERGYPFSKNNIKQKIKDHIKIFLGKNVWYNRYKKFKVFWDEHFKLSKYYKDFETIHKNPPTGYDIYITGSDQVWNTRFAKGDTTFLLDFAPKDSVRVSYAASFANNEIAEEYKENFSHYLRKYKYISVRENNGSKILKDIAGIESDVVLDPTFLLSNTEWNSLVELSKTYVELPQKKYILLYLLTYAHKPDNSIFELVEYLYKNKKYEVIVLGENHKLNVPYSFFEDIGPIDFIKIIRDAEFVITSSYHGVAFSINFNKKFFVVADNNASKDDRILTLLEKFSLQKRLFNKNTIISEINFDEELNIEDLLNIERKMSIKLLNESITRPL